MIKMILAALLVLISVQVFADDVTDSIDEGQEYYQKGEYSKAIEEYESAWFYYSDPVFIYNVGICHHRLAIEYIEEFLEYSDITEEHRKKGQDLLKRLRGDR